MGFLLANRRGFSRTPNFFAIREDETLAVQNGEESFGVHQVLRATQGDYIDPPAHGAKIGQIAGRQWF